MSIQRKLRRQLKGTATVIEARKTGEEVGRASMMQLVTILRRVSHLYFGKPIPQELLVLVDAALREKAPTTFEAADEVIAEVVTEFRFQELKASAPGSLNIVTRAGVKHE